MCGCIFAIHFIHSAPFIWYAAILIVTSVGNVAHSGVRLNPVTADGHGFELPGQTECDNEMVVIHQLQVTSIFAFAMSARL